MDLNRLKESTNKIVLFIAESTRQLTDGISELMVIEQLIACEYGK